MRAVETKSVKYILGYVNQRSSNFVADFFYYNYAYRVIKRQILTYTVTRDIQAISGFFSPYNVLTPFFRKMRIPYNCCSNSSGWPK